MSMVRGATTNNECNLMLGRCRTTNDREYHVRNVHLFRRILCPWGGFQLLSGA